nr:MAG TPA: leucine-rich repeat protein [Caudoviricetes sp.]
MVKLITLENLKTFLDKLREELNESASVDDYCVPDGTEIVTAEMFEKYHLTEKMYLAFPPSVKKIENFNFFAYPFNNKKQLLIAVSLPQCTTVGCMVFQDCSSLTTVSLPQCSIVENNAFRNCSSLTTVSLPQCSTVENNVFQGCVSLLTVSLPQCTTVRETAFGGCVSLLTVSLPQCTTVIRTAFGGCGSLQTLIINEKANIDNINDWGVPFTATIYNETKTKKLVNGRWETV